ncbi:serine hydrolase [Nostoc sp.]|uniref:serine hydrolase n=1 Tax=Nostoc sp. TaxID=1180 RepID=UPI003FA52C04
MRQELWNGEYKLGNNPLKDQSPLLLISIKNPNFSCQAPLQNIPGINQPSPPDILTKPVNASMFAGVVFLGQELPQLKSQINALMARYSFLKPGMFFVDLETGNYLNISGDKVFPAASTIKFPILIALVIAITKSCWLLVWARER